jgi:hypothetical protein
VKLESRKLKSDITLGSGVQFVLVRRMTTRYSIIIATLICASEFVVAATPTSDSELWALGDKKFGHNRFALLTLPNSTGPLNDALVSGLTALLGPPALVRHTASRLKELHAKNLDVLISSPSPAYAQKVVLKALSALPPRSLAGMKICVVGIDPQEFQQAGQRAGTTFVK